MQIELSMPMREALGRAAEVISERRRIESAIATTEREIPKAENALQAARAQLSDVEAAVALGEDLSVGKVRAAIDNAQKEVVTLTARATGLRARLARTDDAAMEAKETLTAARKEFFGTVREQFVAEYRAVAEEFAKVLRTGYGLRMAGLNLQGLEDFQLVDPRDKGRELVKLFPRSNDGSGFRPDWQSSSDAMAVFEVLSPVNEALRDTTSACEPIEARRGREAAKAAEAALKTAPRGMFPNGTPADWFTQSEAPTVPKVEIIPTTMFPDNPEKRYGAQAAHLHPDNPVEAIKRAFDETDKLYSSQ